MGANSLANDGWPRCLCLLMASAGQSNAQCPHINCVFPLCPGPVSAGHPDTTGHMHTEPRQGARDLSKAPGCSKVFTSIVWRWNLLGKNCQFLFKILSLQFSCGSGSMCSVLTHNADRRQWQQVTSISGANHCHIFLTFTTSYFSIEFQHLDFSYSAIGFWNLGGAGFVQLGDIRIHTTGLSSSTWYKVCIVDEVRPLLIFIL